MEMLAGLKSILHSKRAYIFFLEKYCVMQKNGRALHLTEAKAENHYRNIPIANTACLLLGRGRQSFNQWLMMWRGLCHKVNAGRQNICKDGLYV